MCIGYKPRIWHNDEDGKLIDYIRDGCNWTEIAARMGRSEGSVQRHWYYGNLKSDPRAQGVKYRPLLKSGTQPPRGPRP